MIGRFQVTWCAILTMAFVALSAGSSAADEPWAQVLGQNSYWYIHSVQQTGDGGCVLAGYAEPRSTGNRDAWLVKLSATGSVLWQRTYGGPGSESTTAIIETKDKGFLLAGSKAANESVEPDLWLLKLDEAGNVVWQRAYGGSKTDRGHSIETTSDGSYVVAGWSRSFGAGGMDAWCLQLDASGRRVWQKTFGGAGDDVAYEVSQTGDGGFVLAGKTESSGSGAFDGWLLKLDPDGGEEWQKTYGGTGDDAFYSVDVTRDGGYVVCGNYSSPEYFGGSAAWIISTEGSGAILWERRRDTDGEDVAYSVQQTRDGGFAVAGTTGSSGIVYRLSPSGKTRWSAVVGTSYSIRNVAFDLQETPDGGYVVVGSVGYFGTHTYLKAWSTKLNKGGKTTWHWEWGPDGRSTLMAASPTRDGGCILAGATNLSGAGRKDGWLVRMSSQGMILWQRTYGRGEYDYLEEVIETAGGNFIAVGNTERLIDSFLDSDAWLLEVDENGEVILERQFGTSGTDRISSMQQTKDGGYVLVGRTGDARGWDDAWMMKLDAAMEIEWQRRYGTAGVLEFAADVIELPEGGYVVAGASRAAGGLWVFRVDDNGDVAWQRSYGPGPNFTAAIAPAQDGGLVVAVDADPSLLKIDHDGNVIWYKSVEPTDEDFDFADLVPTTDGGHFVTGWIGWDAWYGRLDSAGVVEWEQAIRLNTTDIGLAACQLTDGSFIFAGEAWNENSGTTRGLVVRIATDGTVCDGLGRHTGAATKDSAATPATTSAAAQATSAKARRIPCQVGPSAAVPEDLCLTGLRSSVEESCPDSTTASATAVPPDGTTETTMCRTPDLRTVKSSPQRCRPGDKSVAMVR